MTMNTDWTEVVPFYLNNVFHVLVYDESLKTLLADFQVPSISGYAKTSFTPDLKRWTQITQGKKEVRWFVTGANTAWPATGPYLSGAQRLRIAPPNDSYFTAVVIPATAVPYGPAVYSHSVHTFGADSFPVACEVGTEDGTIADVGPKIGSDVWYRITPNRSGTLTVSTAGSGFDTMIMSYGGNGPIKCNDDQKNGNHEAKLTFGVSAGATYLIQVGGFQGKTGQLKLSVSIADPVVSPTQPDATGELEPGELEPAFEPDPADAPLDPQEPAEGTCTDCEPETMKW